MFFFLQIAMSSVMRNGPKTAIFWDAIHLQWEIAIRTIPR